MATTILRSFKELAKVLGCSKKAEVVENLSIFQVISQKCGHKSAVIWAFLQDQEACKRYGAKGEIFADVPTLANVTGWSESSCRNATMSLILAGYARPAGTTQVRAA